MFRSWTPQSRDRVLTVANTGKTGRARVEASTWPAELGNAEIGKLVVVALHAADGPAPGCLIPGGRPAPVVPGGICTRCGRHVLRPRVEVAIGLHFVPLGGGEGGDHHRVEHPLLAGGQALAESSNLLRERLALLHTRYPCWISHVAPPPVAAGLRASGARTKAARPRTAHTALPTHRSRSRHNLLYIYLSLGGKPLIRMAGCGENEL